MNPRAKKQLEEQAKSKGYKVTIGQEYKTVMKGFSYATHPSGLAWPGLA